MDTNPIPQFRSSRAKDLPEVAGAFESETQQIIAQKSPKADRLVLYTVVGMIATSLFAISVVKVDKVVAGNGKIAPTGGSLFVQPLDRSIVSQILVHPGDLVRRGQVLAVLDPTFAAADFAQLEQKVASDAALVSRLEAEQAGRPYLDGGAKSNTDQILQHSIWLQRQGEFRQSIDDFDARIASEESGTKKSIQDAESDAHHLALASQLAEMQQSLVAKGWGSKSLVIASNDTRVQAERQLKESQNLASQSGHQVVSLKAQRADFVSKWRGDLGVSLVAARNDLSVAAQSLEKAKKVHDLSKLTSPADAVVLSVANASSGSIIDPTGNSPPLFTLTPVDGPLEATIMVSARDVGFIRRGDRVRLKLDAFNFTTHGTAEGMIKSISDGSFSEGDDGQPRPPFFKVRVSMTRVQLRNVPSDFRIIPGMTLTGDILVGGRTIMSYLIEGGLRTGSEAMREP